MDESKIMETAQSMFLQDASRKDVITFFVDNGIDENVAEIKATEAYKNIQEKRKELLSQRNEEETKESRKKGGLSMLAGFGILLAKFVIFLNTGKFYFLFTIVALGLIARGVITFFRTEKEG